MTTSCTEKRSKSVETTQIAESVGPVEHPVMPGGGVESARPAPPPGHGYPSSRGWTRAPHRLRARGSAWTVRQIAGAGKQSTRTEGEQRSKTPRSTKWRLVGFGSPLPTNNPRKLTSPPALSEQVNIVQLTVLGPGTCCLAHAKQPNKWGRTRQRRPRPGRCRRGGVAPSLSAHRMQGRYRPLAVTEVPPRASPYVQTYPVPRTPDLRRSSERSRALVLVDDAFSSRSCRRFPRCRRLRQFRTPNAARTGSRHGVGV